VLESIPSGHSKLPSWFSNLGNPYRLRFLHTEDLKDIDCAISYHQKAVESTPSGHPDLPNFFNNLGNSYLDCFGCTRDLKDIDFAISHHQKAVESTPPGHPDFSNRLNNLGNSYLSRFESTGNLNDIDSAISHHQKAVESTPSGHFRLPIFSSNLGHSYACRFQHSHHYSDIQCSIALHRQGAEANGAPSIRLASAKQAAILSSVHDRSQCLINFSLSISLLSEVAGLEQTIHHRHANLYGHSDFVGSAVATALNLSRPDLALEWLEQSRCLVWNQINQLRTPINNLHMKHSSLASRFIEVVNALESYGTRSILSNPSSHGTFAEDMRLQDDTLNHTLLASEYRHLLEEIRSLSDFHNFLHPPEVINLLSSLPSDGPVIIFNIHNTQCDALALIAGLEEPLHIPLKDFSLTQAEKLHKTLQSNVLDQREVKDRKRAGRIVFNNPAPMLFILKELWHNVVQPILTALGYPVRCHLLWIYTYILIFCTLNSRSFQIL